MAEDIRWKQRFQNFDRAYRLLSEALEEGLDVLSALEKEGVAQRFEYTFELAWKLLKDYLEESGIAILPATPRQAIKEAFAARILADGQTWIDMLGHRNILTHHYDEALFEEAIQAVAEKYLPEMAKMHQFFTERAK
jgi:nucleotidyltransferase substrate binding protein (TIGR01987 family)